jgi:hypothetical protein
MPAVPAPLRIEFELDSEVYPELHAALSGLRSEQARAERLRQLAAAGLVWEKVRIHGPSAMAAPAAPVEQEGQRRPPAAVKRPAEVPPLPAPEATPLPPIERRAAPAAKRPRAPVAEKRRASDFVDLAIDAEVPVASSIAAEPGGSSWPSQQDLARVIGELPVLLDVVPDDHPHGLRPQEPVAWAAKASPEPEEEEFSPAQAEESASADSANDEEALETADAGLHVAALSQKPKSRSRLMRMKERGLFKNG